jgi:hypothetical protein
MADMDKAVTKVIKVEIAMITKVSPIFLILSLITYNQFIVIRITYSRLSHHPGEPEKEHNTPNTHHVAD